MQSTMGTGNLETQIIHVVEVWWLNMKRLCCDKQIWVKVKGNNSNMKTFSNVLNTAAAANMHRKSHLNFRNAAIQTARLNLK